MTCGEQDGEVTGLLRNLVGRHRQRRRQAERQRDEHGGGDQHAIHKGVYRITNDDERDG